MIHEIENFVDTIPHAYHTEGLTPSQGLHILIDLNENGELKEKKSVIINKKGELLDWNQENELKPIENNYDFALREFYSGFITLNKALDSLKKIHSTSPYVLWFKPDSIGKIANSFNEYFKNCRLSEDASEADQREFDNIKLFSEKELVELVKRDEKFKETDKKSYIKVYFQTDIEKLKKCNEQYLLNHLFLKDDFNVEIGDSLFGLSGFLNGANVKKTFMKHPNAKFVVNNRISQKLAYNLYLFEKLLKNKKLPNIVPIFIDKEELNGEFVRIFSKDTKQSFREVIRQLFELHKENISNYYLINWANRGGIIINDVDYVSSFKYQLNDIMVKNIMGIKNKEGEFLRDEAIENVFQFELNIVQRIFNNALIVKTKKETVMFKYFDDIDPKYTTQSNYQNILQYRNNFYDYIYKSKEDAISGRIFYDIIVSNILGDIKQQDDKSYSIKEKLNMLFSLNELFDKQNNNFKNIGDKTMASLIPEFQNNLRRLFKETDYHITSDGEFAFAAGQLIYYVLTKSQTSSKTHSLLEPFISKKDPQLFKLAITRGIEQYKHAFDFGSTRFEKLTSEVLGYDCKMNIKELLPVLLAGYFSQSLIFEKSNNQ